MNAGRIFPGRDDMTKEKTRRTSSSSKATSVSPDTVRTVARDFLQAIADKARGQFVVERKKLVICLAFQGKSALSFVVQ